MRFWVFRLMLLAKSRYRLPWMVLVALMAGQVFVLVAEVMSQEPVLVAVQAY